MMLYMEDLVLYLVDAKNNIDIADLSPRDYSLIYNIGKQLRNGGSMTEGQSKLLLKVLRENQDKLAVLIDIKDSIGSPTFRNKFRSIDHTRKIFIKNNDKIVVKFPFNNKLNNLMYKISPHSSFDKQNKQYEFPIRPDIVDALITNFQDEGFIIDELLLEWYESIKTVKQNPELYLPLLDKDLTLKNCAPTLEKYFNQNKKDTLVSNLFLAKSLNIKIANELLNAVHADKDLPSMIKIYLELDKNRIFLDVKRHSIADLASMLFHMGTWPVMIIMEENPSTFKDLENWYISLSNLGITDQQMSVLFRSDKDREFNDFIKSRNLNNNINNDTKVVFIKPKLPKILPKIKFEANVLVSSCKYYAHFTIQKMVKNHPLSITYIENADDYCG